MTQIVVFFGQKTKWSQFAYFRVKKYMKEKPPPPQTPETPIENKNNVLLILRLRIKQHLKYKIVP